MQQKKLVGILVFCIIALILVHPVLGWQNSGVKSDTLNKYYFWWDEETPFANVSYNTRYPATSASSPLDQSDPRFRISMNVDGGEKPWFAYAALELHVRVQGPSSPEVMVDDVYYGQDTIDASLDEMSSFQIATSSHSNIQDDCKSLPEEGFFPVATWDANGWPTKYDKALTVTLELSLDPDIAAQYNVTVAYTYKFYTSGHWMNEDVTYYDSWLYYYSPS